jgi:hypothetical protein
MITVVLEGGNLIAVLSSNPADVGKQARIINYVDHKDDGNALVIQSDGSAADAHDETLDPDDRLVGPFALVRYRRARAALTALSRVREEREKMRADGSRLDWLEAAAKRSRTGISFDWVPSVEGEPSGFRFMRRHFIGEACQTLRSAIDRARAPLSKEGEQ